MIIGQANGARLVPTDRVGLSKLNNFTGNGIAPTGLTSRIVLQPTVGTAFYVYSMFTSLLRITAAAPVGLTRATWQPVPASGGNSPIIQAQMLDNTIGKLDSQLITPGFILIGGDELDALSEDQSTGGTMNMMLTIYYWQYNV